MEAKETYPDAHVLVDSIARNEGWSPVYRRALEELLKSSAIRAALHEILVQSDDVLKNVGMSDLTKEDSIKNALRAQGVAQGLSQAVEIICTLAATPEEEKETANVSGN